MPLCPIEKYSNVFVETGTFYGDGVQFALNAGYDKVITIELTTKFHQIGCERFRGNPKVQLVLGDSALILGDVIKGIEEPITFWLDGHYSGGDTGMGVKEYPLIKELAQIRDHPIKTHTILIDDWPVLAHVDDEIHHESIIKAVQEINPNYTLYLMDTHFNGEAKPDYILVAKID